MRMKKFLLSLCCLSRVCASPSEQSSSPSQSQSRSGLGVSLSAGIIASETKLTAHHFDGIEYHSYANDLKNKQIKGIALVGADYRFNLGRTNVYLQPELSAGYLPVTAYKDFPRVHAGADYRFAHKLDATFMGLLACSLGLDLFERYSVYAKIGSYYSRWKIVSEYYAAAVPAGGPHEKTSYKNKFGTYGGLGVSMRFDRINLGLEYSQYRNRILKMEHLAQGTETVSTKYKVSFQTVMLKIGYRI